MDEAKYKAFKAHVAAIREKRERQIEAVGDISNGVILRHKTDKRWAFMLPDMTEEGRWRVQYFDEKGFSGHWVRDTQREIVEETTGGGFELRDDEALNRIQNTENFKRGNYVSELIRELNMGKITRSEGDALLAEYDEKTGFEKAA